MLPKLPIIIKNTSNKICPELNFLQKSQKVHMYISLRSIEKGLVTIPEHYNISRFLVPLPQVDRHMRPLTFL